jgi:hypothetical protein
MPSVAWELYLGHMANAPDMENFLQVLVSGNSWPCELLGFRAQGFSDLTFQAGFWFQGISIYAAMRREREREREKDLTLMSLADLAYELWSSDC